MPVSAEDRTRFLQPIGPTPYRLVAGVGGIGTGVFFALDGDETLGRNESRGARLLDVRDYCKLHIVAHYIAVLLGADPAGERVRVLPVGRVGDDPTGHRLMGEMRAVGMDLSEVEAVGDLPTMSSVCFQYPDGSGGNITTVDSAAASLPASAIDRIAPTLTAAGSRAIVLALPEAPLAVRHHLLLAGTAAGALRVASFTSAEIDEARTSGSLALVDLLALNEDEVAALAGRPLDRADPAPTFEACLAAEGGPRRDAALLVSAGSAGAYLLAGGVLVHCPAAEVEAISTAGAGDALLAGVVSAIAVGVPLVGADRGAAATEAGRAGFSGRQLASPLELGVLLASLAVLSPHTIHPGADLAAVRAHARRLGATFAGPLAAAVGDDGDVPLRQRDGAGTAPSAAGAAERTTR